MDFVALERSSHVPFGFLLNTFRVCLQNPLPRPFGCLRWLLPEVFDPSGFGCVLGRGFLSLLWFLAPGNKLLFPQILTHFPPREMLTPLPFPPLRRSAVPDAGSTQDFPALWSHRCAGTSPGMSCCSTASQTVKAHPDCPPSQQIPTKPPPLVLPGAVRRVGFIPPSLSLLFFPSSLSGSQLLITFACQPGLLICYRRAGSGRSENKGDTITLCLLSSPIQISFID